MGTLLDRLGRQFWVVWLACVVWAALWAFLPDTYGFVAWPVVVFVAAIGLIAVFDHLLYYAPIRDALKVTGLDAAPSVPNRLLAILAFSSAALMVTAFWVFDLAPDSVLPLLLSVFLPGMLKRRGEEMAFLRSQRAAA